MYGHYDYSIPFGQFRKQHHNLIGRHAVQSCGRLIQEDHFCDHITEKKLNSNFLEVHFMSFERQVFNSSHLNN